MLRLAKVLLAFAVANWGIAAAVYNVTNWQDTIGPISFVSSMSTFEGGTESWQATSNMFVTWIGALFLVAAKAAAGALCATGGYRMWVAREASSEAFQSAKELALAGCALAIFMLFTAFIVVAETWFELWRSDVLRDSALDSAFRLGGFIGLIAIIISSRDE